MKKLMASLCTLSVFFGLNTFAQLTPQPSSTQSIVQDLGLGKINLVYSRPNVKGRKIFGGMEPYGAFTRASKKLPVAYQLYNY